MARSEYRRQLSALQADVLAAACGGPGARTARLESMGAVLPDDGVALLGRLVRARLQGSLEDDLPRLVARLGMRRFGRLVDGFLAAGPRTRSSLAAVTDDFVDHIRGSLPARLAALADREAARARALVAPEPAPRRPPRRTATDPGALRLRLHPSVTLLPARVVWRQDLVVRERRLGRAERSALAAAARRESLGEIVARLANRRDGEVAAWCQAWVAEGLVTGVV